MTETDLRKRLYDAYVRTGQAGTQAVSLAESYAGRRPYFDRLVRRHLSTDRSARLLDLGCGAGLLLKHLRDQGYVSLEGIDVSEEMVQLARAAGVSCVRQGDLMGLLRERDDSSVDVIFLMDVLEHMTRPEQFELMQQACRVLSPAGRVILHVPNAAGWFGMRIRYGDLTHEAAFTPSSLRQLAMATGFAKVQCFEDTPVVHGVKSGLRWVVWHVATLLPRMALAAETGTLRHVLSQNMTAVVWK